MTANQINYQRNVENNRHNLATEQETARNNRATEAETNRANLAREGETSKHNRASEKQARKELKETRRSHKANEKLGSLTLLETNRHNLATENQAAANLDLNKYLGELSASTSLASAQISADAHKYAAQLSAAASKYSADIGHQNTVEANLSKELIAQADRVQQGKIKDAEKRLNALRLKLDAAKAKNEITMDFYKTTSDSLSRLIQSLIPKETIRR